MDQDKSLNISYDEWRDFLLLAPSSDLHDILRFWRHSTVSHTCILVQPRHLNSKKTKCFQFSPFGALSFHIDLFWLRSVLVFYFQIVYIAFSHLSLVLSLAKSKIIIFIASYKNTKRNNIIVHQCWSLGISADYAQWYHLCEYIYVD